MKRTTMMATLVLLLALIFSACATTVYQGKVYQDGSDIVMIAESAHDWSGVGQVRFTHFDGEKFTGDYTTVSEVIYTSSLTGLFGSAGRTRIATLAPSLGVSSSNLFYGISSLTGNQGSSGRCVYIGAMTGFLNANVLGACKDSKVRTYTVHISTNAGARFPDETKSDTAPEAKNNPQEYE